MDAKRIFSLAVVVMLGILAGPTLAWERWTEPVFLAELNDGEGNPARAPCLSRDGLTMYFHRYIPSSGHNCIVEAYRDTPYGPFLSERVLTELCTTGERTPWISDDELRLYYYSAGIIKMAERPSMGETWTPVKTFDELHQDGADGFRPSLTADELRIFFASTRPGSVGPINLWTATRPSIDAPFGELRALDELNTANGYEYRPCVLPDGLTLYFDGTIPDGHPGFNIYKATRPSTNELFGDLEYVPINTDDYRESDTYVTPDEETIYFYSNREGKKGIWVSRRIGLAGIAARKIEEAIAEKTEALERIDAALEKEIAARELLDELLASGDFGFLTRRDVLKAKVRIRLAMWREQLCKAGLAKSIRRLENTLDALSCDIEPDTWPDEEVTEELMQADLNADGVIDQLDFAILAGHWLKSYQIK